MYPSLMAQLVKNPPAMQETWVRSLGREDPLEQGKAPHSSILAWRIPWGRKESDTTATFTSPTLWFLFTFSKDKHFHFDDVAVVQSLTCVQLFVTPWTAACSSDVHHYLPEFAWIHVH